MLQQHLLCSVMHLGWIQAGTDLRRRPRRRQRLVQCRFQIKYVHVLLQLGWGWAVTELLALPYEARPGADASEVTALAPMPNDEFPSDHLALGVRLMPPCDMFSL